jgi:hypothetical protein
MDAEKIEHDWTDTTPDERIAIFKCRNCSQVWDKRWPKPTNSCTKEFSGLCELIKKIEDDDKTFMSRFFGWAFR